MLCKHTDIRPACELHTHRLWKSHADPDCDSHSYSNSNCNAYAKPDGNSNSNGNAYAKPDGNSYSDTDTWTEDYADAQASSHPSAETVATLARAKNFAIGDRS
jgi:hypothetical protein